MDPKTVTLGELLERDGFSCSCGRKHFAGTDAVVIKSGAIRDRLAEFIVQYGGPQRSGIIKAALRSHRRAAF